MQLCDVFGVNQMKRKNFIQAVLSLGAMNALKPLETLAETLPENGSLMPVLFVGHGSPTNAIDSNEFTEYWKKLATEIPVPKAVLCISAHWLTRGTSITAMSAPKTIHDFGGFPQEMYQIQYPVPGSPDLANETQKLITHTRVELDHDWGLDHGCWSIVKQMYPNADIPVLQLSIDYHKPGKYHYELGKELAALRKKGVLIMGSGNMIHNLRMISPPPGRPFTMEAMNAEYGFDWALELNETFKKHILAGDHLPLLDYQKLGQGAQLAIPTPDHYYPLLYALGLQNANEEVSIFNDKCIAGSLSMTSVRIG